MAERLIDLNTGAEDTDTAAVDKLNCSEQDNEVQLDMKVDSSSDTESQDELPAPSFAYWVDCCTNHINQQACSRKKNESIDFSKQGITFQKCFSHIYWYRPIKNAYIHRVH